MEPFLQSPSFVELAGSTHSASYIYYPAQWPDSSLCHQPGPSFRQAEPRRQDLQSFLPTNISTAIKPKLPFLVFSVFSILQGVRTPLNLTTLPCKTKHPDRPQLCPPFFPIMDSDSQGTCHLRETGRPSREYSDEEWMTDY